MQDLNAVIERYDLFHKAIEGYDLEFAASERRPKWDKDAVEGKTLREARKELALISERLIVLQRTEISR
jgi:hypothetical protein